jgi:hypothetical protein
LCTTLLHSLRAAGCHMLPPHSPATNSCSAKLQQQACHTHAPMNSRVPSCPLSGQVSSLHLVVKGPALSGWLPRAGRQLSASAAKCNSGDALQRWPWASGSALEVLVAGCTGAGVVVVGGGILGFGSACCGQGVGEHVGPKNATLGRRGRHCSRPRNATQPRRLHAAPHGTNHPPHVVGNDPACVHMGGGNQPVPHPLPALTRTVAPDCRTGWSKGPW